jgi:DNA-binding transcriptional ArsR family regulator
MAKKEPRLVPNQAFRALSDPTRRDILRLLRERPRPSGEIAERYPMAWPTISRHLAVLRAANLIVAEKTGTSVIYELNTTVVQELVAHMLDWTGTGVSNAKVAASRVDRHDISPFGVAAAAPASVSRARGGAAAAVRRRR